jgi:Zn ribbon nucleic-acid-binding protein
MKVGRKKGLNNRGCRMCGLDDSFSNCPKCRSLQQVYWTKYSYELGRDIEMRECSECGYKEYSLDYWYDEDYSEEGGTWQKYPDDWCQKECPVHPRQRAFLELARDAFEGDPAIEVAHWVGNWGFGLDDTILIVLSTSERNRWDDLPEAFYPFYFDACDELPFSTGMLTLYKDNISKFDANRPDGWGTITGSLKLTRDKFYDYYDMVVGKE